MLSGSQEVRSIPSYELSSILLGEEGGGVNHDALPRCALF